MAYEPYYLDNSYAGVREVPDNPTPQPFSFQAIDPSFQGKQVTLWGSLPYTIQGPNDPVMQALQAWDAKIPAEELGKYFTDPRTLRIAQQVYQNTDAQNTAARNDNSLTRDAWKAFGGFALGGLGANFLGATGAGEGAGLASGGGTAALGGGAEGASLLGPATGAVEAAPVIGGAGAPAVAGIAEGASPFISAGSIPVAAGGAMDMTGSAAFPAGASAEGMGSGSVFQGGGAAGAAGSASAGGTAAAAGGSTALSRILDGTATTADYLSVGGGLGAAGLGVYGANQQAGALNDLADKYLAIGAPSRARYESSFAPGFTMAKDPGYTDALDQTTKSFLHKASIGGNPAESPNAWMQTLKDVNSTFAYPALQNYRNQNSSTGGYGAFNTAAPAAATGAVNAQTGVYNAIGAGAADIFNPRPAQITLNDIYRAARGGVG